MAETEKFEDIEAWQKGRDLVKEIYGITNSPEFSRDFALRDQIRRSVVSVVSNIAEGHTRRTNKESVLALESLLPVRPQATLAQNLR